MSSNNKMKINRLYQRGESVDAATKAKTAYRRLADVLESKGFRIDSVAQSREYPEPMTSSENYPLGTIEVPVSDLKSTDQILGLKELKPYDFKIICGFEVGQSVDFRQGLSGMFWPDISTFLQAYREKWSDNALPDCIKAVGRDPVSGGKVALKIGRKLPENKDTLVEKAKNFLHPTEVRIR
jgi:hypothetical protein